MRTLLLFLLLTFPWVAPAPELAAAENPPILLENRWVRYVIGPDARNRSFLDRTAGVEYLRTSPPSPCASLRLGAARHDATEAVQMGDQIRLRFPGAGREVLLTREPAEDCLILRVDSVEGGDIDGLTFLDIPLTVRGDPTEPFGACALSLNLHTRVDALPALQSTLVASCERRFQLKGARVAVVAGPMSGLLGMMRTTLERASELPVCKVAGPWAHDSRFSHGSYLFNFGTLTTNTLADWVGMVRSLGFSQIDNHGGGEFFRFGDLELNRSRWPGGWESWRPIVSGLKQEGIGSILHTYAFFIDKRSKYVTPVPDPRLDAFRVFTLAAPLGNSDTELTVVESTAGMSTVTGFFEHNSLVLHLGEELLSFTAVSQSPPWRFTGLKRGALGTRASSHAQGNRARHLKECFGLFVPDPETTLFQEIAANHADVVNTCGFEGIYLDAIDGSSILRGPGEAWYWAQKFVVEIQRRLKQPVGMEMSAMWHQFWQYRTRWQAWDYPQRGHLRFIDAHAQSVNGSLMLPLHLGWWNLQKFDPPQIEPSYPEVMETVAARLVGWDAGISLTAGVNRDALRTTPLFQRAAETLRLCEELRQTGGIDPAKKSALRKPGSEFSLFRDGSGSARFRRIQSQAIAFNSGEPWGRHQLLTNPFQAHPARFRLENRISAGPASPTNSVVIADPAQFAQAPWKASTAAGVSWTLGMTDTSGAWLVATNRGKVPQQAAWVRFERRFEPPLNLKEHQGLELELDGDGSGTVVAIRLESPQHIAFGAIADRYVPIDFTGRRRLALVETESSRWHEYVWNDGKSLYNVHRETVHFDAIETVSVWLQNLPSQREVRIGVGPIRGVPLRPVSWVNPRMRVGDQWLEFPITLKPGGWIEGAGAEDCHAYGPNGQPLGRVIPQGVWPTLGEGTTPIEFDAQTPPGIRARLILLYQGETL